MVKATFYIVNILESKIMGRPRKLQAQKKINGTYREDRETVLTPVEMPSVTLPRPPERYARNMSDNALAYWAMVEPDLVAAGLFKMVDVATLVKWCKLSAHIDELQDLLDQIGWSYETDKGYINERPEVRTLTRLLAEYKPLCREFGFTPLARDGIRKPEQTVVDELEQIGQM